MEKDYLRMLNLLYKIVEANKGTPADEYGEIVP